MTPTDFSTGFSAGISTVDEWVAAAVDAASRGNTRRAESLLRRALESSPRHRDALYNFAELRRAQQRWDEAAELFQRHVDLADDDPDAWIGLGECLARSGRDAEARDALLHARQRAPRDPYAAYALALTSERIGDDIALAADSYLRAARFAPADDKDLRADAAFGAARCLVADDRPHEALKQFAEAERVRAENPDVFDPSAAQTFRREWASFLAAQGRINEARKRLNERGSDECGFSVVARLVGAAVYAQDGNFPQAEASLRHVIRRDGDRDGDVDLLAAEAWSRLAYMNALNDENDESDLETMFARDDLSDQIRAALGFALWRVLDAKDRRDRAFDVLETANALRAASAPPYAQWNAKAHSKFADRLLNVFDEKFLAAPPWDAHAGEGIIFVVGMPRSGTTLVDRVLAASPEVTSRGEFGLLARFAKTRKQFPESIRDVSDHEGRQIAQHMRKQIFNDTQDLAEKNQAKFVVDKTPLHYAFVGLAARLLPRCKIVACERDPRAVAFSCYERPFREGSLVYAYDLSAVARVAEDHRRIMRAWSQRLPNRMHVIRYEELVSNPQEQAMDLYRHCGVTWTPDALHPERVDGAVASASMIEARKPLTDAFRDKWRRYQSRLEPFVSRLSFDPDACDV